MQGRFDEMTGKIIKQIDSLGNKVEDLDEQITSMMKDAGVVVSSMGGGRGEDGGGRGGMVTATGESLEGAK